MNDASKLVKTPGAASDNDIEYSPSLRWQILRILAPLVFAICAISGIVSYHLYASKAVEHMHDDHRKMMNIVAMSMPDAIWNFDDERVHAYLETLSHHDSVHAVRYFNHEGKLVEEIAKRGTAFEPLTHSHNLVYQNSLVKQSVGRLELESTNAPLLTARYQGGTALFVIALIIILLILLLLSWQLKRYVATPLSTAIDHMRQLEDQHAIFHRAPFSQSREINKVIVQLNKLGERLFHMMEALRQNEERYQHFYRDTPALLLVIDNKGNVQDASQLMLETVGWSREQLIGVPFHSIINSQNGKQIHRLSTALRLGSACDDQVMTLRCQHQDDRQVQVVIPAAKGKQTRGTMMLLTDITELTRTQQRLMEHELIDPLTQLPNRLSLNHHLKQLIACDDVFGLLLVNIDRFHSINHHLGPMDGDLLLKETGERLKECHPAWIGRTGGDEFVMTCDINDLRPLVRRIQTAFSHPLLKSGESINLSLSMAGLEAQANDESPSRLMRLLELTVVDIKHEGGNQYRTCVRDSVLEDGEPLFLKERMIREALAMGWFRLYLQPIFRAASPDLEAPELLGAEALIRLEHPELGLVPPNEFIPAAEKTGQIIDIGNWVLEEAAVILSEWRRIGIEERYLSVNASVMQFRDQCMLHQLESLLERYPIHPSQLVVEVTENLMLDSKDSLRYQLQAIRRLGVNLSLDDFGTGFSCLSYLHDLPFGILKVDRSFVMNVETSRRDRELARVIVAMGQSLGMQVVVEGVEERGQAEIFQAMGVHAFQGYLFGRPMPQQAFETRFHANADARVSLLKAVRSAPGTDNDLG
ncbi:EAL domain-containing protein [Cobetia sp. D5]|uniref:putative bifunctional diguanylate cyclase/phosphodiesterase n=1 Tax=Cobetia sp. D5 TaxID=3105867 RepID=UPI002D776640|nr:EAL domain-containing protein [Cobetia sp. D5]